MSTADAGRPDDGARPDAGLAVPTQVGEGGVVGDGGREARGGAARRLPGRSRWWRLGTASTAVAALLWGATAWDGGLRLGTGASADGAAASVAPPGALLVEDASLACPGPQLLGGAGEEGAATGDEEAGGEGGATGGEGGEAGPGAGVEVAAAVAPEGLAGEDAEGGAGGAAVLRATADVGAGTTAGGAGTTDGDAGVDLLDAPGTLAVDGSAAALVHAEGPVAPGLVGGQLGLSAQPGSRGLGLTACTAPAETHWLVAGGGEPGRTEQLVLSNPGPDAVTVQVAVWGADGPAATTGGSAVVVPGRGRSVHLLDALAAQVGSPVVRVRSTGGAVVAHLAEHHREGTTELGSEVVGPAAAPATDLVVPAVRDAGLPTDGDASVTLRLVAPGDEEAVVDLTALTADGAVRLASQVTRVAAGSTVDVVLDDLPDGVHALRLRSDTPVTAGVLLTLAPTGDEPLAPDDAATTTGPGDDDSSTASPPPTADASSTTDDPDPTADASAAPTGPADDQPPVLRPAGETAWVGATTPSRTPVGIALPARGGIPGGRALLAVSVVDATTATVHRVDDRGRVTREELGRIANDTTVTVELPPRSRAVWVTTDGDAGVVASVVLAGADRVGPYLSAVTLPTTPWGRAATEVTVVRP